MGNASSQPVIEEDPWWSPPQQHKPPTTEQQQPGASAPIRKNDDKLDEFRQELARKHEKRRQLLAEKRKEMQDLRDEVLRQKEENEELRRLLQQRNTSTQLQKENEELKQKIVELRTELMKSETLSEKNKELRSDIAKLQEDLQSVNAEVIGFEKERFEYQTHVTALKDVIRVSKQMLVIREQQLTELRQKVAEIEASLAGKEMNVLSDDLRREYERQLRNIRSLRTLYEERQRAEKKEKEKLESELDDAKKDLEEAEAKKAELEERIAALEGDNSKKYDQITALESSLGLAKAECRQVQSEIAVINQLFSHILVGFNNVNDVDLDKLTKILEENHDLLQDIVINEDSGSSSALPKVLLDLVNQINDKEEKSTVVKEEAEETETQTASPQLNSPAEIVKNLPKVWKVLIELLNQQNPPENVVIEPDVDDPCYKLVETPKGPKLVLSVSQTFIRLKNLILEKKSLEKETTRLKQLNSHLEVRLQDQEKRLGLVCSELSKTWHVVGRMQKQHHHLHTQEKILRYELAQKRKLLTELKEELEYCREKWLQAREKNNTTEAQWKQLRTEFASRKTAVADDFNNSLESGYSDERESSSADDEEPGYETDVSESHNKISSPEPVSEDVLDGDGEKTTDVILEVVRDEITEIENEEVGQEVKTDFEVEASTSKEEASDARLKGVEEEVESKAAKLEARVTTEETISAGDKKLERVEAGKSTSEVLTEEKDARLKRLEEEVEIKSAEMRTKETVADKTLEEGEVKLEEAEASTSRATTEETISVADKKLERVESVENVSKVSTEEKAPSRDARLKRLEEEVETKAAGMVAKETVADKTLQEGEVKLEEAAASTSRVTTEETISAGDEKLERVSTSKVSTEERASARDARLKRLEEETKLLMSKVSRTTLRSWQLDVKLENLHGRYGEGSGVQNVEEARDSEDGDGESP